MVIRSDDVLSLFSGAGGFSCGFAQVGLKPVCGAELEPDACITYESNIGNTCHRVDLSDISPSFFKTILKGSEPFAVIGGPPCQGFSTAGSRNNNDPRNRLLFNYLNIVEHVAPRWFIFENVEGLLTSNNGESLSSLISEFIRIGYSVRVQKVNLAGYGIPQTRKRVLIIGNRLGINFTFPEEMYSYDSGKSSNRNSRPFAPTMDEALAGLGMPSRSRSAHALYSQGASINNYDYDMRKGNSSGVVTEHFSLVTLNDQKRYSMLKPGQTMKDLPEEYWHQSFRRRAFRRVQDGTPTEKRGGAPSGIKRLHGNLQSLTITGAASREFIHPHEDRPLTIRECARIQTFPDRYLFSGSAASIMQQIGNAVPPMAAAVLGKYLQTLDGQYGAVSQLGRQLRQPRLLGFVLTEASGMSEALQRTEARLHKFQQEENRESAYAGSPHISSLLKRSA